MHRVWRLREILGEHQRKVLACRHRDLPWRGRCFCRSYHGQDKAASGWHFSRMVHCEPSLKVWVSIVDLLSNLEEGDRVDKYPGLVEQLAEAVAFGAQARGDNLDVMPLHLAREMKGGKKVDAEEVIPSLRAVSSFLEEAKEKRREMGEDQDECGKLKTISSNSEGLEEAFTRMSKEIEDFNIKYQVVQCIIFKFLMMTMNYAG